MDNLPLVSVLMTSYNREKYIAEAIESVLQSSYRNFELIIVDDGSKDNTVNIAKSYAEQDSRVRVYVNEKNLGDYPNRNKAASYAKGKYLKYVDSDDKIYDFGLAYCVQQMEKYPESGLGMRLLYEMGIEDSVCWPPEKIIHEHFFSRQYLTIGPSGTIIRHDLFKQTGGFKADFGVASDMYFNIRMASFAPIVLLQKDFFFYREHDGQEQKNKKGYIKFGYLYFKEMLEQIKLPLEEKEVRFLYQKMKKRYAVALTKYFLRTGDLKSVRSIMKETRFSFSDLLLGFFK